MKIVKFISNFVGAILGFTTWISLLYISLNIGLIFGNSDRLFVSILMIMGVFGLLPGCGVYYVAKNLICNIYILRNKKKEKEVGQMPHLLSNT